jgi:hypothetical protein
MNDNINGTKKVSVQISQPPQHSIVITDEDNKRFKRERDHREWLKAKIKEERDLKNGPNSKNKKP